MGAQTYEAGCFGLSSTSIQVIYQGFLRYEGKDGNFKERWFLLDGLKSALIKCNFTTHQPSGSYGSVLGGDVFIADAKPLVKNTANEAYGFIITTLTGTQIVFCTKTLQDQEIWVSAITKTSSGFTFAVADRLAERELLAGKYSLVRELGRGASGIVSLYTSQGKPFAIKKFVPQKSKGIPNRKVVPVASGNVHKSANNSIPEDVRKEVALLKKASNLPFIIRLDDVILDTEQKEYYLVMEYMGGGAIAEWDNSRKCYRKSFASANNHNCLLDENKIRTYMTNLVLAVQGLHLNNLSHRDIKPENLMADEEHSLCKLGDLGVAHYFKEENGQLRDEEDVEAMELWDINQGDVLQDSKHDLRGMIKSTKGTYQFLPPESLSGDAFCAFKADIWAIGVTLYALLFDSLPYYSTDVTELFDKIEKDPLEFPVSCEDQDVKDLLEKILEKDPEKRLTLEGILQHTWTHRNIDSKYLRKQVKALQEAPTLFVQECELAAAIRQDTFAQDTSANSVLVQIEEEYRPNPINTMEIMLPTWFHPHRELVAAQMHYDWCKMKALGGWKYGSVRDDANLLHPCMLPMRSLDETAKKRNFCAVDEIVKCVVALGVGVIYHRPLKVKVKETPFPIETVQLCWEMMMLIDLLAENSHKVWATEYTANGWQFGAEFDEINKTHHSLKPYMLLDENDKRLTREGVTSVLKSCIYLGCKFSISHRGRKK